MEDKAENTEFRGRQFQLMLEKIALFERKKIELNTLIQNLEALVYVLGRDTINTRILPKIHDLEVLNALLLADNRQPDAEECSSIDLMLKELKYLIGAHWDFETGNHSPS
jgi:hypothetical protein